MRVIIALFGIISMIGVPVSLIGFFIQLARKRPNKRVWGIISICFVVAFVICMIATPGSPKQSPNKPTDTGTAKVETTEPPIETNKPETTEPPIEKSEAEKFAEKNSLSLEVAESLETVLTGMELTDKSRVGVFHYDLSDVYDWKQIEDWANGERYSAYMDMEHIWYIYVKDNAVVGVRDGHGNIFYSVE